VYYLLIPTVLYLENTIVVQGDIVKRKGKGKKKEKKEKKEKSMSYCII
jgi:hypothetical protein